MRTTGHWGGVAQLVEQENHNLCVGGSSPSTATIVSVAGIE